MPSSTERVPTPQYFAAFEKGHTSVRGRMARQRAAPPSLAASARGKDTRYGAKA